MSAFASVQDVITLWRPLTAAETERAEALLPLVSDLLRQAAVNVGKDLDAMIFREPSMRSTVKIVTVDVIARILRQNTTGEPVSQESQSGLGYSWQGTYAIPGGGMANAIMNNDLKRLGLLKQRIGVIDFYAQGRQYSDYDPDADWDG